jgi:hypothetical protein
MPIRSTSRSSSTGTRIAFTSNVNTAAAKMCGAPLKAAIVPAITASRNDCTPKIRMLVTSHRWAAIRIWSTSTRAAISVTIRLPNSGF